MMKKRILLLEDNPLTARGLQYLLEQREYQVEIAMRAAEMRDLLGHGERARNFDLAILDVGLPDGDGFELGAELRAEHREMPLIFLTAKDDEADIVRGLELGAEDYITKPFRNRELLARVQAILRRVEHSHRSNQYKEKENWKDIGPFRVDLTSGEVWLRKTRGRDDEPKKDDSVDYERLNLTALESRLLRLLLENSNHVVTRERLLDEIWDASGSIVNNNTISVYMRRIRQKIGPLDTIETLKNVGYRLNVEPRNPGE